MLFGSAKQVKLFIRRAAFNYGAPCLRDGNKVHVIVASPNEETVIMRIARELGGEPV